MLLSEKSSDEISGKNMSRYFDLLTSIPDTPFLSVVERKGNEDYKHKLNKYTVSDYLNHTNSAKYNIKYNICLYIKYNII